jgi:hypothetical protein
MRQFRPAKDYPKRGDRTAYVCYTCREADRKRQTHPGMFHSPGICDCACRDEGRT